MLKWEHKHGFVIFRVVLLFYLIEFIKNMVNYSIHKHIATLSENSERHFSFEVNLISWNGNDPILDIRKWDKSTGRPLKGITLSKRELNELKEVLKEF